MKLALAIAVILASCGKSTLPSAEPNASIGPGTPMAGPHAPRTLSQVSEARAPVPPGYVVTPMGIFPADCVVQLGVGETFDLTGNVMRDSAVVRTRKPCTRSHFLRDGTKLMADYVGDVAHDWAASASATMPPLLSISARWTVPAAPSQAGGQTLYYFPGIQPADSTFVVQPVLAWQGGAWTIASWDCCDQGQANASPTKQVQTGDLIEGVASGSQCSGDVCKAWKITTTDLTSGETTTLDADSDHGFAIMKPLVWGVGGALEEWYVANCDQYSGDTTTFSNIKVSGANGPFSPTWAKEVTSVGRACNITMSTAPDSVEIARSHQMNTAPTPAGHCRCGGSWPNECKMCDH